MIPCLRRKGKEKMTRVFSSSSVAFFPGPGQTWRMVPIITCSVGDRGQKMAVALLILGLSVSSVRAEWANGRGERFFGPDMAETEACRIAEATAVEDALRQVAGERLSAEDTLACT